MPFLVNAQLPPADSFRRWVTDAVLRLIYEPAARAAGVAAPEPDPT